MIRFDNVEVIFDKFTAIPGLSLEVHEGEFFTLLGPSGCGKSTALRTIAGFVSPHRGQVLIDGKDVTRVPADKRGVGMVFQNYALFPSMSVWENIAFGLKVKRVKKAEIAQRVADIAEKVELSENQLNKNLDELSGGQQQRVAIARALVLEPKILLLDEPLSNLDARLRHQLRLELKKLQREFGITTLYVTHDQDEALNMSDRIAVFNRGQVEQVGTPQEVYENSATPFVCSFIGESSQLNSGLLEKLAGLGAPVDIHKTAFVRLEKPTLQQTPDSFGVDGVVEQVNYHGLYSNIQVRSFDSLVEILLPHNGQEVPLVGEHLTWYLNPAHILQYEEEA